MKLDIFQVDAFTDKAFGGNPAAVVPLDAWLSDEVMLAIAAENNLAETAFFVQNGDRYEIRWFTPKVEVDLCGHATLASAYVIFECLKRESESIDFHSHRSGSLGVTKEGGKMVLDFPAYPVSEIEQSDELAGAIGAIPSKVYETQGNMVMMRLESESQIRELSPDFNALLGIDYDEFIVTAPGDDCDFVSRMFAPRIGINEDPVTGAIHCSLIPYWADQLGKNEMFARQVSERGGELFCELQGDRVKIGGEAVLYLKGEIYVGAEDEKSITA
ncbi:MAG: PhzF family phenazine biosynthesis protein [Pyrinomonadaceae bacterium]|nr:PhzF family phenazine biosynthesis protein [Acidobacteriota bacterium]MBP7374875.1 PhzF family phenazine biosynthesis protein [Pyrinomonadaceae bacterium]